MRVAHVSDIHVRNLRYHDEYRRVFDDLYEKLRELRPDFVVNTGDLAHTKVQISPEFVQMTSEHIRSVAAIAPYHVILGNHDLNLMNRERQDAISPVVDSLRSGPEPLPVFLHKKSGRVALADPMLYDFDFDVNLWVFGMADSENYPRPSQWRQHPDAINIGLFHGSISGCVTDSSWRMTHTEHDISLFDGLDYCMLGDIHKQQFFNDRRFAYAGSLIQQNFGEELDKGFLLWDIDGKDEHVVRHVPLRGSRKFYTLRLNDDMTFPETDVEVGSRVRISPPRELTLAEQREVEKRARQLFDPYDVVTLSATSVSSSRKTLSAGGLHVENMRQLAVQERLLAEYLENKEIPQSMVERVLDMNRKYQTHVDQSDDVVRNISWRLNKLSWSNLFNYGEENLIDFDAVCGLTGIFAPNASGKSNLVDVVLETCFDGTTRGINKNIFLINDNKERATMVADVTANGRNYVIERTIERVKYGSKKSGEQKEWGKTVVNFALVDELGEHQSALVGTLRPETERNIRQHLGTYDDMLLTSLSAQWNPLDIIACKETDRKKILYKFLDLDIFEEKHRLARDEGKHYHKRLAEMDGSGLEDAVDSLRTNVSRRRADIEEQETTLTTLTSRVGEIDDEMVELASRREKVDVVDEEEVRSTLSSVERRRSKVVNDIVELNVELTATTVELANLVEVGSSFDLGVHETAERRLDDVKRELRSLRTTLRGANESLTSKGRSLKLLDEVPCGDEFPQCKFLRDAFRSRDELPRVISDVGRMDAEIVKLESEVPELEKSVQALQAYRETLERKTSLETKLTNMRLTSENLSLKLADVDKQVADCGRRLAQAAASREAAGRNIELDARLASLRDEKRSLSSRVAGLREELKEATRALGSDEGTLEKLSSQLEQLEELRETCVAFEHYCQAMGKDGIAYQVMAQKLPLINDEINKILGSSAEFGVLIEHDSDEQSIRIYIQYGEYRMRLLELGSGAEKMLASIAIRAALLSISSLPKSNMFIIDEGFGKLDSRNIENFQKMFDYLKSVFEHVIVISHVDTMKDMVDNIIEISTDADGYAHVEVGGKER